MPYPARARVSTGLRRGVAIAALSALVVGCQTAMSVEEAKKIAASFQGAAFVPPPRTIGE